MGAYPGLSNNPVILDHSEDPTDVGLQAPDQGDANEYVSQLGLYAPFDFSPEPFVQVNERQKGLFNSLCTNVARADIACRYLEVSQAWEARLFERGYQHLIPRAGGGFDLPGANSIWGPIAVADASANYPTNIYGRDKDIIVGAIARELPKVQFFPRSLNDPADIAAADAANRYKYLYEKNAKLRSVLGMAAQYMYTEDRVCLFTRHVRSAEKYGRNADGTAKGSEETEVLGKLETKVPMQAQEQYQMHFVQLYWDQDITHCKARYPWIRNRIQSATHGLGELGFDKIARISTRDGLYGRIVTSDSLARVVTEQYTFLRPMAFYDDVIEERDRGWFLENFPDGALVVFVGQEFAYARNCALDDHIAIVHSQYAVGQNRRSMGGNNIATQKRLNNFMDLLDDFARRTVPRIWYNAEYYSMEAIAEQQNTPGHASPVVIPPNIPVETTFGVEPLPQPQPFLYEMAQWYFGELSASLSGATPAIYGGDAQGEKPVGTTLVERDAAFGRIGVPWNLIKEGICTAAYQAVKQAARCRQDPIEGTGSDGQSHSLRPEELQGNVEVFAEYDSAIPETWNQREQRYTEVVAGAPSNPFYAELLKSPRNMRAIANNVRMSELEIPGESSSEKQLNEIEQMKKAGPQPNPQHLQLESAITTMGGQGVNPAAMTQASNALSQIKPMVSSVPVAQDASENHGVEAQTCLEWMNDPSEGLRFKWGVAQEQQVFQNVYLHWQEHSNMVQKLSQPPSGKPPAVSINFKDMPPEAQVQALKEAGIDISTQQAVDERTRQTNRKIAEKVIPKTIPEHMTIKRVTREPSKNPEGGKNG